MGVVVTIKALYAKLTVAVIANEALADYLVFISP